MIEVINAKLIRTPTADHAYKVVFQYRGGGCSEHPIATVREGEALIRSKDAWQAQHIDELRECGLLEKRPLRFDLVDKTKPENAEPLGIGNPNR